MRRKCLLFILMLIISSIGITTAQTLQVQGVVRDEAGTPAIGVSVIVEGTSTGTITDIDGAFRLKAERGSFLRFSFIGYQSQRLEARESMTVTLVPDVQVMDEVVVTGMSKVDKRLFTGAADQLAAEDIMLDGVADISRSLEGRSAGVSLQNVSATFGTAPKIRIRGATSILGDSKPLWVIDGVVVEDVTEVSPTDLSSGDAVTLISSAVAGLNAEDIESFNILKDGSATSIYGAKAMAGVIVITTKKGKQNTPPSELYR